MSKPNIKCQILLGKDQQKQLLTIARQTLEVYFRDRTIPEIIVKDNDLQQELGAFVTLTNHGQLRGCIGRFEPHEPLYRVVQQMAIEAATKDHRFYPITYSELKDIKIEISVLSPNQKINDWRQIKLGEHGVIIRKGLQIGTFLPQVATETGWDLETFLSNLCSHKAGLPPDNYKDPSAALYIFTAQVFGEK